ncbi:g5565 [Coccomyxa elongata]
MPLASRKNAVADLKEFAKWETEYLFFSYKVWKEIATYFDVETHAADAPPASDQTVQDTAARLERQLEDTRIAASRDASNLQAELRLWEVQAGIHLQQLQSTTATAEYHRQRAEQLQEELESERTKMVILERQLREVEGSCRVAAAQAGGAANIREILACFISDLKAFLKQADLKEDDFMSYETASHELTEIFEDTMQKILFG